MDSVKKRRLTTAKSFSSCFGFIFFVSSDPVNFFFFKMTPKA